MSKVSKMVGVLVFAVITVLFLQSGLLGVTASASEEQEVISPEITEVEISEEGQQLELEKGVEYILSYLVDGEGWNFNEIKYRLKGYDWEMYDEEIENDYLFIEKCEENKTGKVSMKVLCKSGDLSDIGVSLLNELTGEVKEYISETVVTDSHEPTPEPTPSYPDEWNEVTPTPEPTPEPTPGPELKEIDTSEWVFEGISTIYDGREHVVEVEGLPEWVTPVYNVDNKRTNAGKTVVTVTFEVPEGYKVPAPMTAEINIDKATLPDLKLTDSMANFQNVGDGTYKVVATSGNLPAGVSLGYTINGKPVEGDCKITNAGAYVVAVDYVMSEEIAANYNQTTPEKVIYNVKSAEQNDWEFDGNKDSWYNEPGKIKVDIGINNSNSAEEGNMNYAGCAGGLNYTLDYDRTILNLKELQLYDGSNGTSMNITTSGYMKPVISEDKSSIYVFANGTWCANEYIHIGDYVFEVLDETAEDIVINITKPSLMDSSLKGLPIATYGIVVKHTSTKYDLTLPIGNSISTLTDIAMNVIADIQDSENEPTEDVEEALDIERKALDNNSCEENQESDVIENATTETEQKLEATENQENKTETESENSETDFEQEEAVTPEPTDIDQNASISEEVETEE